MHSCIRPTFEPGLLTSPDPRIQAGSTGLRVFGALPSACSQCQGILGCLGLFRVEGLDLLGFRRKTAWRPFQAISEGWGRVSRSLDP